MAQKRTSEKTKQKIVEQHRAGMTITELAKEFNLNSKTIWWHLKVANAYKYQNQQDEIEDYNMNKLVNAFFINLMSNLKNPVRLGYVEERLLKWYKEVIQWADDEVFWFDYWEEFCGYDEIRLRNKIKELARKQLQILKRKKTKELKLIKQLHAIPKN